LADRIGTRPRSVTLASVLLERDCYIRIEDLTLHIEDLAEPRDISGA